MNKEKITVKINQVKLPNKMHLDIQRNTKANVFKPKKGKGSFKRNKRVDVE